LLPTFIISRKAKFQLRVSQHITGKQATRLQSNPETCTWTYGVQLWGSASNPNLEILERF